MQVNNQMQIHHGVPLSHRLIHTLHHLIALAYFQRIMHRSLSYVRIGHQLPLPGSSLCVSAGHEQ